MKLLKKIYDKFVKKPTEWIEIKVHDPLTKIKNRVTGRDDDEERGKEEE